MSILNRILAGLFLAIIPFVVLMTAVTVFASNDICAKHIFLTDEAIHWAQAATVAEVGLNGGYYNVDETPPIIENMPFYIWGPGVPIFYGTIGHWIGWQFCSPILINLTVLAIGIFLFVMITQPDKKQLALLAILVTTYPSLVLYAPFVMLQALNIGLATLLASLLFYIATCDEISNHHMILATIAILLAAMLRITWVFLLMPLFIVYILDHLSWRRLILGISIGVTVMMTSLVVYIAGSAPFPNVFSMALDRLSLNLLDGLRAFAANIRRNLFRIPRGNIAQIILRLEMFIILVVLSHRIFKDFSERNFRDSSLRLAIFHCLGIIMIFSFVLITYDMYDWRDYRVFAPVLFLSLLLLIAEKRYRLSTSLVALLLLSYVTIAPLYQYYVESHFGDELAYTGQLESNEAELHELEVYYDPSSQSRWCNTILYTLNFQYQPEILLAFDDGMGLSFLVDVSLVENALKSKYLMLNDGVEIADDANVQILMTLEDGYLYLNLDADCE